MPAKISPADVVCKPYSALDCRRIDDQAAGECDEFARLKLTKLPRRQRRTPRLAAPGFGMSLAKTSGAFFCSPND
jgi:hypothetical protein